MDGVNPDTVWTWNAIGKRAGAWNLALDSPEFEKGFLLNHLISELLPAAGDSSEINADPITGQAAWYDLRVRIERIAADQPRRTAPEFGVLGHPPSLVPPPNILRYGARFLSEARLVEERSFLERRAEEVLEQQESAPLRWAARLAPEDLPVIEGFEVGRVYEPGAGAMAGDFYDLYPTGPSRLTCLVPCWLGAVLSSRWASSTRASGTATIRIGWYAPAMPAYASRAPTSMPSSTCAVGSTGFRSRSRSPPPGRAR